MNPIARAPWPAKAGARPPRRCWSPPPWATLAAAIALAGLRQLPARASTPPPSPDGSGIIGAIPLVLRWLKIGALAATGIGLAAAVAVAHGLRRPLHGAARWAREPDLRRGNLRAGTGTGPRPARRPSPGVRRRRARGALCAHPHRQGSWVVIPNLLTWPDSVVVLDIKRENWAASAGFRAAHGQTVLLFDPLRPRRAAPRATIRSATSTAPVRSAVLDELQRIATMLFPVPPSADLFWAESARTGFVGVGAYLAETPARPFTLGAIYAELTTGDPRTRLPALVARRQVDGPATFVRLRARAVRLLRRLGEHLRLRPSDPDQSPEPVAEPPGRRSHRQSDFDLRTLRSRRISLYLATSPENLTRSPLYGLLLQQPADLVPRAP